MGSITASAVKSLRERTGLPMMDCKQALQESDGNEDAAVEWLRKRGGQIMEKRGGRETTFGRVGVYANLDEGVGAMVELKCESAPVTNNEEFIQLADDLAKQLATGPGASGADELLDQPSPSHEGMTLREQKDDLFNRIREVFNVGRIVRIDGPCAVYSHNATTIAGVLVQVDGSATPESVKDVCMHVAAMNPSAVSTDELDPEEVEKERKILTEAAREEGKPEKIIDKMVEGRLRNFYAQRVLNEQPFVKDDKVTVKQYAKNNGYEIVKFVHWVIGA